MIQLEQVRTLEQKVKQAVELISRLKSDNEYLNSRLTTYEVRIQELENLINSFRNSQSEIEEGIINALEELDHIQGSGSSPSQEFSTANPSTVSNTEITQDPVEISITTESSYHEEDYSVSTSRENEEDKSTSSEQDLFAENFEDSKDEEPTLGIF